MSSVSQETLQQAIRALSEATQVLSAYIRQEQTKNEVIWLPTTDAAKTLKTTPVILRRLVNNGLLKYGTHYRKDGARELKFAVKAMENIWLPHQSSASQLEG